MIHIPVSKNRIYVKSFVDSNGRKLPESLLTYPEIDAAGDIVKPDGGDWTFHDTHPALNRRVNFDHGVLIGKAENPDGSYGVSLRPVQLENGKTAQIPVGVTKFFQSAKDTKGLVSGTGPIRTALQLAEQVEDLVSRKIMQGVSLELGEDERKPGLWKSLGRSPLENRNAWRCDHWIGLGWAHTFVPINKHSKVIDQTTESLISLAESGRIGSKPLAAPLAKSLTAFRSIKRPPVVKSGFSGTKLEKSMNDELDPTGDMTDELASEDTPGANKPTPNAIHQVLQAFTDVASMLDGIINGPDHEHAEGLALLGEVKGQIQQVAMDLMGKAAAMFPDAGFETEPDGDEGVNPEEPSDDDGDELPTTDDGGLMTKAFKRGYPKRLKLFSKNQLAKAEGTVTISVQTLDRLRKTLSAISPKKK